MNSGSVVVFQCYGRCCEFHRSRNIRELVRITEDEDPRSTGEIAQQIRDAAVSALQEEDRKGKLQWMMGPWPGKWIRKEFLNRRLPL